MASDLKAAVALDDIRRAHQAIAPLARRIAKLVSYFHNGLGLSTPVSSEVRQFSSCHFTLRGAATGYIASTHAARRIHTPGKSGFSIGRCP